MVSSWWAEVTSDSCCYLLWALTGASLRSGGQCLSVPPSPELHKPLEVGDMAHTSICPSLWHSVWHLVSPEWVFIE